MTKNWDHDVDVTALIDRTDLFLLDERRAFRSALLFLDKKGDSESRARIQVLRRLADLIYAGTVETGTNPESISHDVPSSDTRWKLLMEHGGSKPDGPSEHSENFDVLIAEMTPDFRLPLRYVEGINDNGGKCNLLLLHKWNTKPQLEEDGASGPVFDLASIGGTFNTFHTGHKDYFELAFRLARQVHIYVASDSYARERKTYSPRDFSKRRAAITRYLSKEGFTQRVEVDRLDDPADLDSFAIQTPGLDLVVAEDAYLGWFSSLNSRRQEVGLSGYSILCKPRTRYHGHDIASALWASREPSDLPSAGESLRLFEP